MTLVRRDRGDAVLWRSIYDARPGFVMPTRVIEDSAQAIALFEPTGVTVKARVGTRGGPRGRNMLPGGWDGRYEDRVWDGPGCLRLHLPGTGISVMRWWHPEKQRYDGWGWYVNLELPWRRTAMGFDSRDLLLDIVVAEDLSSWRWKDADELEWALEVGTMDAETAEFTKSAGAQAIALLEARAFPFDTDWHRWRPDPAWTLPTLPPHWADGA